MSASEGQSVSGPMNRIRMPIVPVQPSSTCIAADSITPLDACTDVAVKHVQIPASSGKANNADVNCVPKQPFHK